MNTIVHRLNRGPFSGEVVRHDTGPFAGWYAYAWRGGMQTGSTQAIGKAGAIGGLHAAMLDYFAKSKQAARGKPSPKI
jgi:hypothetical protein